MVHSIRRRLRARYGDLCHTIDSIIWFGPENIPSNGLLLFALGFHGAISEGLAHAEVAGSPVDVAAFYLDDVSISGTHKASKDFFEGFQKAWTTGASNRTLRSASSSRPKPCQLQPTPWTPRRGGLSAMTSASRC